MTSPSRGDPTGAMQVAKREANMNSYIDRVRASTKLLNSGEVREGHKLMTPTLIEEVELCSRVHGDYEPKTHRRAENAMFKYCAALKRLAP